MIDLFFMGGPLFMGILSVLLVAIVVLSVRYMMSSEKSESALNLIKSVGLFAMVIGILGQLIGLFEAFKFIEEAGTISPGLLAGGFKVSMITTLYGIIIYVISYIVWLTFKLKD